MSETLHIGKTLQRIIKNSKILCLVDGEHYPPVTKWALDHLIKNKGIIKALFFLGGTEKVENAFEELKSKRIDYRIYKSEKNKKIDFELFEEILKTKELDIVVDLSDEPVLDYSRRLKMASLSLKYEKSYLGSDFFFQPPQRSKILKKPSLSIIGTGKRIGKTAVGVTVARLLKNKSFDPVIVCMGRGGPEKPEYINIEKIDISAKTLLEVVEKGQHAASDYWEDALLAGVSTVGCRRCGGGFAGNPFVSNVIKGAKLTNSLKNKFVIMEGSGSTLPPVRTDQNIVLVGAGQSLRKISGYMGQYRLMLADLVIVTMCEEPIADEQKVEEVYKSIKKVNPDVDIALTKFRPQPLGNIRKKKVFVATTAPGKIRDKILNYLEKQYSCEVVGYSKHLSNREKLRKDLDKNLDECDILLTEIKAASIDVAAKKAEKMDVDIIFMHNEMKLTGGDIKNLNEAILNIGERAKRKK
ncbi:MAG: cyclic 2,3-diphosphoglycerate synthetase [Candidatus Mcinerneyibacterium aminivorans]|uniref:Cyclic 2,3-diphosphoglycerate synthetase n=1 Tax=Candidatus Mcinerneyibacterium aminivorans TaxID=2703815 RepID=A0A5D0MDR6_9BACT|nr:MAG: cyclic 2,3-diphosphoglycerate synthetase [Candidatus Mcinerneyibacterium aminivorans]